MQAEAGQSLDVQQRQLEGWAMQRGATLTGTHVEAGVSGGVPFHERPEDGKLWADLRRGDALVSSSSTGFRSAADCLAVVETFKGRGVSLYRQGAGVSAIARRTGLDRKTVRKVIAGGLEPATYGPRQRRPTVSGRRQPDGRQQGR
jgi:hypothetical protein